MVECARRLRRTDPHTRAVCPVQPDQPLAALASQQRGEGAQLRDSTPDWSGVLRKWMERRESVEGGGEHERDEMTRDTNPWGNTIPWRIMKCEANEERQSED